MKKHFPYILVIILLGLISFMLASSKEDERRLSISQNMSIYSALFRDVNLLYVDETNPEKLIEKSIEGMLSSLDPYTVFYPESHANDFKMLTTNSYGGIGAVISGKNNNSLVIIREPYKNTPSHKAGLLPGDTIVSIDGISIKGKTTEETKNMLQGEPGTTVALELSRVGAKKPIDVKIKREKVSLPSVSYYGMLNDSTGYILLNSFASETAMTEVRSALISLLDKHNTLSSLVFDVRGNGGGLLDQAVDISNLFLPQNSLIVSTKGKNEAVNRSFSATKAPLFPNLPLVVLIDRGSASASEIFAGAIQDYDRGVLIGERSFGKGLVQTTRELPYNSYLKITTSKYYIPSGRCIQAVDYSHRNEDGSVGYVPDSLITEFTTQAGRKVYDGGGITPDIKTSDVDYATITKELVYSDLFFDFANVYAAEGHQLPAPSDFVMTDEIYNAFVQYVQTRNFSYETISQLQLDKLIQAAKAEKYYDKIASRLEPLRAELTDSIARDIVLFRPEIEEFLATELMQRYYMQEGALEYHILHDPELKQAVELLANKEEYAKILSKE